MPAAATHGALIDRLVAVEEYLRAGGFADVAELVRAALASPRQSVRGTVVGSRRGGESPQRQAARQRRDDALRALARSVGEDGLGIAKVAARVARQVRRYEGTSWPRDRRRSTAPCDGDRALLFEVLKPGLLIPGPRQIQRILLNNQA
jgi:hypothetical protein